MSGGTDRRFRKGTGSVLTACSLIVCSQRRTAAFPVLITGRAISSVLVLNLFTVLSCNKARAQSSAPETAAAPARWAAIGERMLKVVIKRLLIVWLTFAGLSGCAGGLPFRRPTGARDAQPQFHNRLRISENTDIVGV